MMVGERRLNLPLTVTTAQEDSGPEIEENIDTPPRSNRKFRNKEQHEPQNNVVDAYENPTELFQWINFGNLQGATQRVLDNPEEASIWIVSYEGAKSSSFGNSVKWKYLPLHLACLSPVRSGKLFRALLWAYPKASRQQAHDGNLPIHLLLSEGCKDCDIIEMMLNAYPESVQKHDRKGRSLMQLVTHTYQSGRISKDAMLCILSIFRQWVTNREQQGAEERDVVIKLDYPQIPEEEKRNENYKPCESDHVVPPSPETETVLPESSNSKPSSPLDIDLEERLDATTAERDSLREIVSKLQKQNARKDETIMALNKQLHSSNGEVKKQTEKMEKLQTQFICTEQKLMDLQANHTECLEALEQLESDALITENRLQTKIVILEEELVEVKAARPAQQPMEAPKREKSPTNSSQAASKEMFASVQERDATGGVEELEGHAPWTPTEDKLARHQVELQSDCHNLVSHVHALSSNLPSNELVKGLRQRCRELENDNHALQRELRLLQHRDGADVDHKFSLDEQNRLHKQQLHEYTKSLRAAKKSIASLRDVMTKNNAASLAKVDSQNKRIRELKKANAELKEQVRDLSRMMSSSAEGTPNQEAQDLSSRLDQVSAYLVAISAFQRQLFQEDGGDAPPKSRGGDEETPVHGKGDSNKLQIKSRRNLVEVMKKEEMVLNTKNRDEILRAAAAYRTDVRAHMEKRDITSGLVRKRDELEREKVLNTKNRDDILRAAAAYRTDVRAAHLEKRDVALDLVRKRDELESITAGLGNLQT